MEGSTRSRFMVYRGFEVYGGSLSRLTYKRLRVQCGLWILGLLRKFVGF